MSISLLRCVSSSCLLLSATESTHVGDRTSSLGTRGPSVFTQCLFPEWKRFNYIVCYRKGTTFVCSGCYNKVLWIQGLNPRTLLLPDLEAGSLGSERQHGWGLGSSLLLGSHTAVFLPHPHRAGPEQACPLASSYKGTN